MGTKKRKSWNRLLILSILAILIFHVFYVPNIYAESTYPLILGAHRGDSVDYIENTMPAIQAALEDPSYNFIEIDIQYTKDEQIVVFHDDTLLRLQGKYLTVADLTYDELSEISEYHIPTYQEAMDLIKDQKRVNIEIKSQGNLEQDQKLVNFVIQDCQERAILDLILLSSISPEVVSYSSETYPEVKTGIIYLVHPITYIPIESIVTDFYENVDSIGADYVMLHGINIKNYHLLTELKPENITLVFWYFSDEMLVLQQDIGLW